ncbi:MAG: hypothetical protein AAEJ57_06070, partial [Opitutales bacterium]
LHGVDHDQLDEEGSSLACHTFHGEGGLDGFRTGGQGSFWGECPTHRDFLGSLDANPLIAD